MLNTIYHFPKKNNPLLVCHRWLEALHRPSGFSYMSTSPLSHVRNPIPTHPIREADWNQ